MEGGLVSFVVEADTAAWLLLTQLVEPVVAVPALTSSRNKTYRHRTRSVPAYAAVSRVGSETGLGSSAGSVC